MGPLGHLILGTSSIFLPCLSSGRFPTCPPVIYATIACQILILFLFLGSIEPFFNHFFLLESYIWKKNGILTIFKHIYDRFSPRSVTMFYTTFPDVHTMKNAQSGMDNWVVGFRHARCYKLPLFLACRLWLVTKYFTEFYSLFQ